MIDFDPTTKESIWAAVETAALTTDRGAAYRAALVSAIGSPHKVVVTRDSVTVLDYTWNGSLTIQNNQVVVLGAPDTITTLVDADLDSGVWEGKITSNDGTRYVSGSVGRNDELFVLIDDIVAADGVSVQAIKLGLPSSYDGAAPTPAPAPAPAPSPAGGTFDPITKGWGNTGYTGPSALAPVTMGAWRAWISAAWEEDREGSQWAINDIWNFANWGLTPGPTVQRVRKTGDAANQRQSLQIDYDIGTSWPGYSGGGAGEVKGFPRISKGMLPGQSVSTGIDNLPIKASEIGTAILGNQGLSVSVDTTKGHLAHDMRLMSTGGGYGTSYSEGIPYIRLELMLVIKQFDDYGRHGISGSRPAGAYRGQYEIAGKQYQVYLQRGNDAGLLVLLPEELSVGQSGVAPTFYDLGAIIKWGMAMTFGQFKVNPFTAGGGDFARSFTHVSYDHTDPLISPDWYLGSDSLGVENEYGALDMVIEGDYMVIEPAGAPAPTPPPAPAPAPAPSPGGGGYIDPNWTRKTPNGTVALWLRDVQDGPRLVPTHHVGIHNHAYPLQGQPPANYVLQTSAEPDVNAYDVWRNHNNDATGFNFHTFTSESTQDWANMDATFNYYLGQGKKLFYNNFPFPAWMSSRPGAYWEGYPNYSALGGPWCPSDETGWAKHQEIVRKVNARYNLTWNESANEPSLNWVDNRVAYNGTNFFGGTDTDNSEAGKARRRRALARNQRSVYEGAKSGNSNTIVLGPGFVSFSSGEFNRMQDFFNEPTGIGGLAGDYMEGMCIHFYSTSGAGIGALPFATEMRNAKIMRDNNNSAWQLHQTETGVGSWGSSMSVSNHALFNKRKIYVCAALGFETNIFYSYDSERDNDTGSLWWIGSPDVNAEVKQALIDARNDVTDKTIMQGAVLTDGRVWLHYGDRSEKYA